MYVRKGQQQQQQIDLKHNLSDIGHDHQPAGQSGDEQGEGGRRGGGSMRV
jgi:hypothetical protein